MKKKLATKNVATILLGAFLVVTIALAFAPPSKAETAADYEAYARYEAKVEGVNADHLVATLRCESHFKAGAIGDHGKSYGLAQIHLPDHPKVTREQALDGYWAIDFTIQAFLDGDANLWSCWRKFYG